jgi:hypothetical protein
MSRKNYRRLRVPASSLLLGTAVALAVGLGWNWSGAIFSEMVTLCAVTIVYLAGGSDSDTGAVLGDRPDERQELIRLKAANLAMIVALVAVVGACIIAAAVKAAFWPFEVLVVIIGVSYLVGLGIYGHERPVTEAEIDQSENDRGLQAL